MWPIDQNCYFRWTECKAKNRTTEHITSEHLTESSSLAKGFVFRCENKIKLEIIKLWSVRVKDGFLSLQRLIFLLLLWHRNWQQLRLPTKRIQNYSRCKIIFAFNQQKILCGILGPEVLFLFSLQTFALKKAHKIFPRFSPLMFLFQSFFRRRWRKCMFSATSLTRNWILKSLNIPTGPLSGAKKTLTTEIWGWQFSTGVEGGWVFVTQLTSQRCPSTRW